MEFTEFEQYFSTQRISRYVQATNKSEKQAMKAYKANSKVTNGKIIAEQTLGFWTDLFEVHHYRLLKGKPIQIFKHLPSGYGRKEVNDELARVRRFRNRISHNEPICFQGNKINYSKTKEVYYSIVNLLNWIDAEILKFTSDVDKILETITNAEKI